MKSFAHQPSPVLVGVVRRESASEAIADIRNCETHGANVIDLHLSHLDARYQTVEALSKVIAHAKTPVMVLHYNMRCDGSPVRCTEEERVALLLRGLEAGAACVDMQGYTFDLPSKDAFREEFSSLGYSFTKRRPREVVVDSAVIDRQCEFIDRVHGMGREVLLSCHPGIFMPAEEIVELALFLEKRGPDVIKIVTRANSREELLESFRTMVLLKKEVKTQVHYHAAGKEGQLSRFVNPLLGAYMVFCNDGYHPGSDWEQPDLQTARAVIDGILRTL